MPDPNLFDEGDPSQWRLAIRVLAMPIGTIMATVNELWKTVLASFAPMWEKLAESGKDGRFLRMMIFFFTTRPSGRVKPA